MNRRVGLIVGGVSALGASIVALLLSRKTTKAVEDAVKGLAPPVPAGGTNTVTVHLTHYYPFQAGLSASERKTEGEPVDATGAPLHTVEDFLAGKSEYVSLAGDLQGHKGTLWPFGQKILIPWGGKTLVGRVVDTGGHFHGGSKVFRVVGEEPIDVCVFSKDNHPPKSSVKAQVVVGDTFAKGVARLDQAGKPQVTGLIGLDVYASTAHFPRRKSILDRAREMVARRRASGTWVVDGGGAPGSFPGGRTRRGA